MVLQHVNGDDSFCGNGHGHVLYTRSGDVGVGPDVVEQADAGVLQRDAGVLPRDGEARVDEAVPAPIQIKPVLN